MLWTEPSKLLLLELEQSMDEGRDASHLSAEAHRIVSISNNPFIKESTASDLFLKLQDLPIQASFPYSEPNEIAEIIGPIDVNPRYQIISSDDLFDSIYGGILGKCIGCLLGKPIEGWCCL